MPRLRILVIRGLLDPDAVDRLLPWLIAFSTLEGLRLALAQPINEHQLARLRQALPLLHVLCLAHAGVTHTVRLTDDLTRLDLAGWSAPRTAPPLQLIAEPLRAP